VAAALVVASAGISVLVRAASKRLEQPWSERYVFEYCALWIRKLTPPARAQAEARKVKKLFRLSIESSRLSLLSVPCRPMVYVPGCRQAG